MSQSQMQQHADALRESQINLDNFAILVKTRTESWERAQATLQEAEAALTEAGYALEEAKTGHRAAQGIVSTRLDHMQYLCNKARPYGDGGWGLVSAAMECSSSKYNGRGD